MHVPTSTNRLSSRFWIHSDANNIKDINTSSVHPQLPQLLSSPANHPPPMSGDDHIQDAVLRHSLENPEEFWAHQAEHLHWHTKPSTILGRSHKSLGDDADNASHDTWEWFPDGEISTCYNCVDRHVLAGRGSEVAIYYDSPVTGVKESYTYEQLLDHVEVLAGALREEGVRKGDVVMLYSKSTQRPHLMKLPLTPTSVI